MAGEKWTFGIKSLKSGVPGALGIMSVALTENGETLKGSATLETSEETINWIETEEKGKRKAISQNDSETTLTFEVANPSLEVMALYCGGTVTVGPPKAYSPPRSKDAINRSFLIETKEGFNIEIPYGAVNATPLSGQIGTDSVMTLKVVVTVQLPDAPGVAQITYKDKA